MNGIRRISLFSNILVLLIEFHTYVNTLDEQLNAWIGHLNCKTQYREISNLEPTQSNPCWCKMMWVRINFTLSLSRGKEKGNFHSKFTLSGKMYSPIVGETCE